MVGIKGKTCRIFLRRFTGAEEAGGQYNDEEIFIHVVPFMDD
jgi:hypothetical protein